MERNQENFEALFADVVAGLKEYYPALNNPQAVSEIKQGAKADYDSTGNNQADYEWVRNVVETMAPDEDECSRLHRVLQDGYLCLGPFATNSAKEEVGRFGRPGAQPGTKNEMLFALQTAWTFIHGSTDERLKKEASQLLRDNSEWKDFWD